MENETPHFKRISQAISYISENYPTQPSLSEIAAHVHLSKAHFQRLFTEWAGTSPKKFLQYISLQHAKKLLATDHLTLSDAAWETGLSGTSRLHDLFVTIEAMTPAEYKNGGRNLNIEYSITESTFGPLLVASTEKGICRLTFDSEDGSALNELKNEFPEAQFFEKKNKMHLNATAIFETNTALSKIKLHLKGTRFQLKVWESLLKIPSGQLSTYGKIAKNIANPSASRAVGTAVGSNPVAYLIPCHRVIRSSGHLGGYRWGNSRKSTIIGWEIAKNENTDNEIF